MVFILGFSLFLTSFNRDNRRMILPDKRLTRLISCTFWTLLLYSKLAFTILLSLRFTNLNFGFLRTFCRRLTLGWMPLLDNSLSYLIHFQVANHRILSPDCFRQSYILSWSLQDSLILLFYQCLVFFLLFHELIYFLQPEVVSLMVLCRIDTRSSSHTDRWLNTLSSWMSHIQIMHPCDGFTMFFKNLL